MTPERLQELNELAEKIKRNNENVAAIQIAVGVIAMKVDSNAKAQKIKVTPLNSRDYALQTLVLPPAFFPHIIRALENYAEEIDAETSVARAKLKHA